MALTPPNHEVPWQPCPKLLEMGAMAWPEPLELQACMVTHVPRAYPHSTPILAWEGEHPPSPTWCRPLAASPCPGRALPPCSLSPCPAVSKRRVARGAWGWEDFSSPSPVVAVLPQLLCWAPSPLPGSFPVFVGACFSVVLALDLRLSCCSAKSSAICLLSTCLGLSVSQHSYVLQLFPFPPLLFWVLGASFPSNVAVGRGSAWQQWHLGHPVPLSHSSLPAQDEALNAQPCAIIPLCVPHPARCGVCTGSWFLSWAVSTQQHPEPSVPIQEHSSPKDAQHPSRLLDTIHEHQRPSPAWCHSPQQRSSPSRLGFPLTNPPFLSPEPCGSQAPSLEQQPWPAEPSSLPATVATLLNTKGEWGRSYS